MKTGFFEHLKNMYGEDIAKNLKPIAVFSIIIILVVVLYLTGNASLANKILGAGIAGAILVAFNIFRKEN